MKIQITIDKRTLVGLVCGYIEKQMGDIGFKVSDVKIETKSKQNYSSEWEIADFRAVLETDG